MARCDEAALPAPSPRRALFQAGAEAGAKRSAAPKMASLIGRVEPFRLAGRRWLFHSIGMAVTLPIRRMSRADKLRAMEALWADLSRDEAGIHSPDWHGVVLRETEQLVRDGKAKFSDWQAASRRIRRKAARLA